MNSSYVLIPAEDFMVVLERCCPYNASFDCCSRPVCKDYIDTDCINCSGKRLKNGK